MMDRLVDVVRRRAGEMDAGRGQGRFGVVSSYDPSSGAAKVTLQPEGVLTGWLPVLSQWVGAGWGLHAPLQPGDQVFVLPHEGDVDHGVIVGRAFSAQARPPQGVDPGEMVLRHGSGSVIRIGAEGKVVIQDPSGTRMTFDNNGTVTLDGTLRVTGDILDLDGEAGSLQQLRNAYNDHRHPGVQPGGGTSGITDLPV